MLVFRLFLLGLGGKGPRWLLQLFLLPVHSVWFLQLQFAFESPDFRRDVSWLHLGEPLLFVKAYFLFDQWDLRLLRLWKCLPATGAIGPIGPWNHQSMDNFDWSSAHPVPQRKIRCTIAQHLPHLCHFLHFRWSSACLGWLRVHSTSYFCFDPKWYKDDKSMNFDKLL